VGEVENDLEIGRIALGLAGIDEKRRVNVELLRRCRVAEEGHPPRGSCKDVPGVERRLVQGDHLGRLGPKSLEERFLLGERGAEIRNPNGLDTGRARGEKGVGEMGDDGRHVVLGGFAGIALEESADGALGLDHGGSPLGRHYVQPGACEHFSIISDLC